MDVLLTDLDGQVEHRREEHKIRRQERERKRAEELRRLQDNAQEDLIQDRATALTIEPQPSTSKTSERLQKLEKV